MPLSKLPFLFVILSGIAFAADRPTLGARDLLLAEMESPPAIAWTRLADAYRHETEYRQNFGADLFDQFVRFLFPASGREKRTMFMPLPYWGPKKPQYKIFDWKKFESAHFEFYAYPPHEEVFHRVVNYLEEDFERNNRMFGVQGKFTKKIPVVLYQTRRDFEQTFIVGGVVPEGLGGVTEIFSWKRATFPFEGEFSKFEHVAKHEGTHIYQIAKGAKKLPLWFIEGNAETNSIYWDADAEMVIRDAFFNGFFYPISQLWQIQGTWLMYKEGNFITNLIWDEYGEEGFRKIYERADTLSFDQNLKESLGITIEDLDIKVQAALSKRYAADLRRKDLSDSAQLVEEGRVLLHAHGPFYLSGGAQGPRTALFVNHVDTRGKIVREKVVSDGEYNTESLGYFRKGAWMDDRRIVYSVKKSSNDEIRVSTYRYNEKERRFEIGRPKAYSWPSIDILENPVLVGDRGLAFVGQRDGFSNVYLFDTQTRRLESLTQGKGHCSGLDYSKARNRLVFSMERERAKGRIYYNRDLYAVDLDTRALVPLTSTPDVREEDPRFSADGAYIAYTASGRDQDRTHDLYLYHLDSKRTRRLSRMRVGAKSPQWGAEGSILFNGYKGMRPRIYQVPFPKASSLLDLEWPQGGFESVVLKNGAWALKDAPGAEKIEAEKPLPEGASVDDRGRLLLNLDGEAYTVGSTARLDGKLVLRAKRGRPSQKEAEEQLSNRYFAWDSRGPVSIDTQMVATPYLRPDLKKKAEESLEGRVIVNAFTQGDRSLLLVNNRLARDQEKFKKRPDLSFVMFDLSKGTYSDLPEGLVDDADDTDRLIQWVSFLPEGAILFAVSEDRRGPYRLFVYDAARRTYLRYSDRADRFRVSKDHGHVVWAEDGVLYHRSTLGKASKVRLRDSNARILAFHFKDDGLCSIFTVHRGDWKVHEWDPATGTVRSEFTIAHDPKSKTDLAIFDETTGNLVLRSKKPGADAPQELTLWLRDKQEIYSLSDQGEGLRYSAVQFRGGYLFFTEHRRPFEPAKEWVWKDRFRDSIDPVTHAEKIADRQWVLDGPGKLLWADFANADTVEVARENAGFARAGSTIYYAAPQDDAFSIFAYDTTEKKHRKAVSCERQCAFPKTDGKDLFWSTKTEDRWTASRAPLRSLEAPVQNGVPGHDVVRPEPKDGEVVAQSRAIDRPTYEGPELTHGKIENLYLQNRPFQNYFKLQSLSAAAAYDGSNFRYFASGFLDNIFSDRGIFVDSIFLGDAKFATLGYADLRYGNSYTFFYNSREKIDNFGPGYTKTFLLDRFQEINLFAQFELQRYGAATPDTAQFVGPDVENRNFYLVKTGAAYGYDATQWDYHGPVRGSRIFLRAEGGYDVLNGEVSNLDANVDARLYHSILPRFGFAHRIVAGTSQGSLPNVFLLGGNLSFRGFGFDDLEGQNYWVFSEDMRVPVFDFVGAKFFDPVDYVLGAFTRFFDIRSGLYGDVGQVWYNSANPDLEYSVGYFVNVPTLLGINFRFNQGFLGRKNIGIWLGSNW